MNHHQARPRLCALLLTLCGGVTFVAILQHHYDSTASRQLQFIFDSSGEVAHTHRDKSFTCEVRFANDTVRRGYIDKHDISQACSKPPLLDATGRNGQMAAIVQSFNHQSSAFEVTSSLASQAPALRDVLVYDDGSTDGSKETFQKAFQFHRNDINGRLFSSPNIHEIRNYNLGMELLHREQPEVKYYALMQDDDVLRGNPDPWVLRAIQLLEEFPKLCVLGGYIGWQHIANGLLSPHEFYVEEKSYNRANHSKVHNTCHGMPFQFTMGVASSPMVIRKACYEDIGPLSEMYTEPGDPGIMFDIEYSTRAWANGWQVGLFYSRYTHGVGGHGTMSSPEKRRQRIRAALRGNSYVKQRFKSVACHYTSMDANQLPNAY